MARKTKKKKSKKTVEALTHEEAKRKNIPTAEFQSVMRKDELTPIRLAYERRNRDLDPQLVWRGKDEQDWSDLVVHAPPLYIQEKVHPKVLVDDLVHRTDEEEESQDDQLNLFADFNGLAEDARSTEFYQHDANWTNRMILGDGLQVMASLAEREGLRGQVQCIYIDPPYGIKFNSNFQWSTTSRDVKDGKTDHITREPEQVKAFRDTWRDGIHSYLTYLRDRLTVSRDLLHESGSIFVQIGDENIHRVRAVMDEVFGDENFCGIISFSKTSGLGAKLLPSRYDFLIWFAKKIDVVKFRQPYVDKSLEDGSASSYNWVELSDGARRGLNAAEKRNLNLVPEDATIYRPSDLTSQGNPRFPFRYRGKEYSATWKTTEMGLKRLGLANRLHVARNSLRYVRLLKDFPVMPVSNYWEDTGTGSFTDQKIYVVQTGTKTIQRCILMTTDPGDLVLDPTCGSGTTAYVAEQWGRRWITIDTSRVALALARSRVMGARYPYYFLADSKQGQLKEAELSRSAPSEALTTGDIRHGFVYERVPHLMLKSISNNAEIDVICQQYQVEFDALRKGINSALSKEWEEWEIPYDADEQWSEKVKSLHSEWKAIRLACRAEVDASVAAKADYEYRYDKPYEDKSKVRVAGPFTVESLSPHRMIGVDENDELVDQVSDASERHGTVRDFSQVVLENLRTAGVHQAHKEDRIEFSSLVPWPGYLICAEARYVEGEGESAVERRAGVFVGPEFGTVQREDLVLAARECGDAGFDVLISCAFNYEAHATEFSKLGRIPVLKARMNADLHMSEELKNTGKGNLFVIFGEPDIDIIKLTDDQLQVKINGVDVFHPSTGEVQSDGADGIACWFIDTNYNEESFFVRHAYFLGANDPYKLLRTTLKAEINQEAWATLNSDISRPFDEPESGRIAVKVINHLGDEVMKVFRVDE